LYTRAFRYERADDVPAACAALRRHGEGARVLAGGQSLLPMINVGLAAPEVLVDISRVAEAREINASDGYLSIGALVTHRELIASEVARAAQPLLGAAAAHIGSARIRNRGTLGGSLAHSDPAAELPVVMTALGASYELTDGRAEREVRAEEFAITVFTTELEPDELLVAARVPVLGPGWGWSFREVSRRRGDFALVSAAALVRSAGEGGGVGEGGGAGVIVEARLALGGVADRPVRLAAVEAALTGATRDEIAARVGGGVWGGRPPEGSTGPIEGISPVTDTGASAEYRRHLARVLAVQALEEACARSEGTVSGKRGP
jgi:aerobic carbon-monoxide dehydrogenase medium subunit